MFEYSRIIRSITATPLHAIAMFIAVTAIFSGCGGKSDETPPVADTRSITDGLGIERKLPESVERAVSLAPDLTEVIFAVGGGKKLVGVTSYCDFPAETTEISKVGDTMSPNIETIVALKPQVVFVSTASQLEKFASLLEKHGITIFVVDTKDFESLYKNMVVVGEILVTKDDAEDAAKLLQKRVASIQVDSEQDMPKVFVQIDQESLYTVGRDSFITGVVKMAGGDLLTADLPTAYPKLSKETALAMNPEVIILSVSDNNKEPNAVFSNSPAVKNGRVLKIDANLLSRPGPRLVEALEQIAAGLKVEKVIKKAA